MNARRLVLFLVGCIGTRLALTWIAYKYTAILWYLGALALVPAVGFFVIYFGGLRKTGPEVFGDKIWWNDLRPLHGLLYLSFAILALNGVKEHAWKFLLADVLIGLSAFVLHHFSSLL